MTIRAVVFDIGGVLKITPETGWRERWEDRLGMSMDTLIKRLHQQGCDGELGTCTEAEWRVSLRQITGMSETETDAFMHDLWEEYLGELNVDLADYFVSLRLRYKTAILSNSFLGAREKEQERYHFDQMTDLIIYSHEVGLAKPDPRIYALTCERLGVAPSEIIFLDDNAINIAAARDFGIHAVQFKDTQKAIADITAYLQQAATDH